MAADCYLFATSPPSLMDSSSSSSVRLHIPPRVPPLIFLLGWANNPKFPPNTINAVPGLDGIIGQSPVGTAIQVAGTDPESPSNLLTLPKQFVVPRGGEYFFVPSVSALKRVMSV